MKNTILVVLGTRPEAIKLAPVILDLKRDGIFKVQVCVTGQHRSMLDQILKFFEIVPDFDLDLMVPNQNLASLTAKIVTDCYELFREIKPDQIMVQGDTTTAFAAGLAAFYQKIPVLHVEAGLRTRNLYSPFPEEFNRTALSRLASVHFAPTEGAQNNLLEEGIPSNSIVLTGNTVIDALLLAVEKLKGKEIEIAGLPANLFAGNQKVVLITGHRRENFGEGFKRICAAIVSLAAEFPTVNFVYPVHLNPNVQSVVLEILSGYNNIFLIDPLDYPSFVFLMQRSYLIITDSGGIQEEAPSLGKPVLVIRDTTERPEGVLHGTVKMVGTDINAITEASRELLNDPIAYGLMAEIKNPYGDGLASKRITEFLNIYQQNQGTRVTSSLS